MREPAEQRTPLVKVIVPCYNYAEYLDGCVESILGQDGVEVRVLIADDCSPDETPDVAARIARSDDRVEHRRNEENLGLISTVNRGLAWADDGDYVVVISADDMLTPGSLQRATGVMEANPRVGLAYGSVVRFESDRPLPRTGKRRRRGTKVWSGEDWIRIRCGIGHNCIASPEAVVRTSVQRQVGFYDLASYHASELNMWLRIAAVSDVAYVKEAQALYRIHRESMLRTMLAGNGGELVDLKTRRIAFEGFFDGDTSQLRDAARLRTMAGDALARQALWRASRAYDRDEVDGSAGVSAEEWIGFARETSPDVRRLREWWGLQLRRRIGAGRSLWFPLFVATGAAHRVRSHYNWRRLHTRGI